VGKLLLGLECAAVVFRLIAACGIKQTELNLTDALVFAGKDYT